MESCEDLKDISLGILAWRTPETLKRTLSSYSRSHLLNSVGEVTVFFNQVHEADLKIAESFGLRCIPSEENIGIGPALSKLVSSSTKNHFMFLEGDWLCVEEHEQVKQRLRIGLDLINRRNVDVVRYRHRIRYGWPLYSRATYWKKGARAISDHLLDTIHWVKKPEERFPQIKKKILGGENWYFASSKHANYTNNPCLYEREFLERELLPRAYGTGISLEVDLHDWWKSQEFSVAQGPGLFKHRPLEISGQGYTASSAFKLRLFRALGIA